MGTGHEVTRTNAREQFRELQELAGDNPRILGLYLGGSHAKGFETPESDYDCYVVVTDEARSEMAYLERRSAQMDVRVFSMSEFEAHATIGSPNRWDRYNFAHGKVLIDKTGGDSQTLVDEKGTLPSEAAEVHARWALDAYVNATYRSTKNRRNSHVLASRLDAAESLYYLLEALFAMNGRLRPYNKYLLWELEQYPIERLPGAEDPASFADAIEAVLTRADAETQRRLFAGMEVVARERGLGDVLDAWGSALDSLRR